MNISPIRTDADYEAALTRIDSLMDAELDTPEGDELDVLSTLVESYEAKHFVIPDAIPLKQSGSGCSNGEWCPKT